MRKTTLTIMITGLLACGAAVAGGKEGHGKAEAEAKARGEAQLSIGSVRTMGSATAFSKLDANTDGRISQSEAEAMKGLPQQWSKLDADGNGSLSMTEFASLTANSSGIRGEGNDGADPTLGVETDTGIAGRVGTDSGSESGERSQASAETEAGARLKVEDISRENAVQAFNRVDADGDFKLDEQEAAGIDGLQQQFGQLDRDGDGALDYAEFNAVTQVEHERR